MRAVDERRRRGRRARARPARSSRRYRRATCGTVVAEAAWALRRSGRAVRHDDQPLAHLPEHRAASTPRNPCSEYMFLDDSACNLASLNLTKFLREDGSFDVEGYRHAVRVFFLAQEILVDFSAYPDRQDRRELARLPPARPGLRQPRHAAHAPRHPVRLRRGPRDRRRRSPRSCAATPTACRPRWPRSKGPFAGLRQEPRADAARDAHAPRRGVRRSTATRAPRTCGAPRARTGTTRSSSARSTATATRRPRCSRRPARSACSWTATPPASSPTSRW